MSYCAAFCVTENAYKGCTFAPKIIGIMKIEKFKVLLYLKKSGLDKKGKAPIMGRITLNNSMAQFSTKLSCTPELWNPRESRLNGKGKEAVETNGKIDKILLAVNAAYDALVEKKTDFCATDIKNQMQGSMETQMTFMKMVDTLCDERITTAMFSFFQTIGIIIPIARTHVAGKDIERGKTCVISTFYVPPQTL